MPRGRKPAIATAPVATAQTAPSDIPVKRKIGWPKGRPRKVPQVMAPADGPVLILRRAGTDTFSVYKECASIAEATVELMKAMDTDATAREEFLPILGRKLSIQTSLVLAHAKAAANHQSEQTHPQQVASVPPAQATA